MEALMEILPVTLYVLAIVLVVVLIIAVVRFIQTMDKVNIILDDVEKKTKSLNGIFSIIDTVTDSLSIFSDTLVEGITSIVAKVFRKRRKNKKREESLEDE